jgi:hypothetical protein
MPSLDTKLWALVAVSVILFLFLNFSDLLEFKLPRERVRLNLNEG